MSETTERREQIDAVTFLRTYVPMAQEGATAEEIGAKLDRSSQYVTSRASQLRSDYPTIPKLKRRTSSNAANVANVLAELLGPSTEEGDSESDSEFVKG